MKTSGAYNDASAKAIHWRMSALGFSHLAEDAVQDYFLNRLEGKSLHQSPLLFVISYLRKNIGDARRGTYDVRKNLCGAVALSEAMESMEGLAVDPWQSVEDRMDARSLIDTIPHGRDREIVVARFLIGYNNADIARAFKISETRVQQIIDEIIDNLIRPANLRSMHALP